VTVALPAQVASFSPEVNEVVSFDPSKGEFPEAVAFDARGNMYVTLPPIGEIRKIRPNGSQSIIATIAPGTDVGPVGLALDDRRRIYVAVTSFEPATHGVYRVKQNGTHRRLPGTAAISFPNGVALDEDGTAYVTDTILGAVWRIRPGGQAKLWIQDDLLVGNGSAGFGFPIGANGIALRGNKLYVSVSELGRIVSIRIRGNGRAGTPRIFAEDPALNPADGIAFDVRGNLYVAVIAQSTLVRIKRNGTIETLATAADGLDFPSSLAFGTGNGRPRRSAFVTNFAIGPPGGAGPGIVQVRIGIRGQPLP
jgi:sugar lactone lactonase YvrE